MPWRKTSDPYKIWLSEIILQQTRVQQGLVYYNRFVEKYPDVSSLAKAAEEDVLKMWQGLGYYSRARNLHHTVKIIAVDFKGVFPSDYKTLLKLKGIGPYTAAAITSIAFQNPEPVVDGNVIRLISRVFGIDKSYYSPIGKKRIDEIVRNKIDRKDPGTFNQAMMEYGSAFCIPKNPDCRNCIFNSSCFAFKNNQVDQLPVRKKPLTQRQRYFHYIVILNNKDESIYLKKRTQDDIWKNLYDFPLIENEKWLAEKSLLKNKLFQLLFENITREKIFQSPTMKHQLTHQTLYAIFYIYQVGNENNYFKQDLVKINFSNLDKLPVPRLIDRFIKKKLKKFLKSGNLF